MYGVYGMPPSMATARATKLSKDVHICLTLYMLHFSKLKSNVLFWENVYANVACHDRHQQVNSLPRKDFNEI